MVRAHIFISAVMAGWLFFIPPVFGSGLLGDVDGNGVVEVIDALKTAQYCSGESVANFHSEYADVNSDQVIDHQDSILMGQFCVGILREFPCLPANWEPLQETFFLTDTHKVRLQEDRFLILDRKHAQRLSQGYKSLAARQGIPLAITTDSLLHLFYLIYNDMLRSVRCSQFGSSFSNFLRWLDIYAREEFNTPFDTPLLNRGAEELLFFTRVGVALVLDERNVEPEDGIVREICDRINGCLSGIYAHEGIDPETGLDYGSFNFDDYLNGLTPQLYPFLRAWHWFESWRVYTVLSPVSEKDDARLLSTVMLSWLLEEYPRLKNMISPMTEFMRLTTCPAAGMDIMALEDVLNNLFGDDYTAKGYALLVEDGNLDALRKALQCQEMENDDWIRWAGSPLLPDIPLFQETCAPVVAGRELPSGLDAASTLFASSTAHGILQPELGVYPSLENSLDTWTENFREWTLEQWQCSGQYRWLSMLRVLSDAPAEGVPNFMLSEGWHRKKLNTQLASWTQLRSSNLNMIPTPVPTPVSTPTTVPGGTATPGASDNWGDVDQNGQITIMDALMVAQFCVGLNPSGFSEILADVNESGSVTVVDALLIAQYVVGLVDNLPVNTPPPTASPTSPPFPAGYVEPCPEFYRQIGGLCTDLIDTAEETGFSVVHHTLILTRIRGWCEKLADISELLVAGEPLDREARMFIQDWGEKISSCFTPDSVTSEIYFSPLLITDIYQNNGLYLYCALGNFQPVIMMYNVPGETYPWAAAGYIYTFFEKNDPSELSFSDWEREYNEGFVDLEEWMRAFVSW